MVDNRTTYAARAKYACDANYTLVGEELRTCGDGGAWSEETPECLCELPVFFGWSGFTLRGSVK